MTEQIFQVCIIPLLAALTGFIVQYLRIKSKEISGKMNDEVAQKYTEMITETIVNCVIATNQTYVEALKKEGKFDEQAQKVAFEKTLNAVLAVLSDDAKNYLREITGDINTYLTQRIEAEVNKNKK